MGLKRCLGQLGVSSLLLVGYRHLPVFPATFLRVNAMKEHAFSIRIHFPDGQADGYRTITIDDWAGEGTICPRSLFPQKKKENVFQKPGVYVLTGDSDETGKTTKVYIGEGAIILDRIHSHYAKKDFWTKVILFTSKDINKGHIQYLESRLVEYARNSPQCELDNGNMPKLPTLSDTEASRMENFLLKMRQCFSAIGVRVFEKFDENRHDQKTLLFLNAKGVQATGYESEDGFIVCKGSQAIIKETKSLDARVKAKRASLLAEGILKEENGVYVFTQDCPLNSPSKASNILHGASSDGLTLWQNQKGISLRTLRESELET